MLQFKDIKQGGIVYMLDKANLDYKEGKVTGVSFPRVEIGQQGMVVDVTIESEGKTATYTIPESLSVTYAKNLVLSTEKHSLVQEVEQVKTTAENALKCVESNKQLVNTACQLLFDLNPAEKEKAETEKRFNNLEESVTEIKGMISSLLKKLE